MTCLTVSSDLTMGLQIRVDSITVGISTFLTSLLSVVSAGNYSAKKSQPEVQISEIRFMRTNYDCVYQPWEPFLTSEEMPLPCKM